ncbi:MAG: TetR/AcrR family transcriptional regulator [Armatimonadetes bacterium]|nr:TetR/AcrR family transcriptional regulator [Anaerolineae bacterium]
MCPYPVQVTHDSILEQARMMVEAQGVDALSLNKLAAALNIKAPSLYRYFASKTALMHAINTQTTHALVWALQAAADFSGHEPLLRATHMARAYRVFVHANPVMYALAFGNPAPDERPDAALAEQLAQPLQTVMAALVGEANALIALRGIWALIHGFVMLELTAQFQREGDLDVAFNEAVKVYFRGWMSV